MLELRITVIVPVMVTRVVVAIAAGQKPTLAGEHRFNGARSAESCIRKAGAEPGLTPGRVGLADAKQRSG
jgi:hypothetical protein